MRPPGRCLRAGPGTDLDALVRAGVLLPEEAAAVKQFTAYLRDVAGRVAAGASRDEARDAAYPAHYPEDARPSDDVEKVGGVTRQREGGNPE